MPNQLTLFHSGSNGRQVVKILQALGVEVYEDGTWLVAADGVKDCQELQGGTVVPGAVKALMKYCRVNK